MHECTCLTQGPADARARTESRHGHDQARACADPARRNPGKFRRFLGGLARRRGSRIRVTPEDPTRRREDSMISAGRLSLIAAAALLAAGLSADPILHSTYLGGSGADSVDAVAVDPRNGDIVVAGHTFSTTLPHTAGGAQPHSGGGVDGFVMRFDARLGTLLQATYLGGSGGEEVLGLAIQPSTGDVYVAGFTTSKDFPGTASGAQPAIAGLTNGFVAHLDPMLSALRGADVLRGNQRGQDPRRCRAPRRR